MRMGMANMYSFEDIRKIVEDVAQHHNELLDAISKLRIVISEKDTELKSTQLKLQESERRFEAASVACHVDVGKEVQKRTNDLKYNTINALHDIINLIEYHK